MAMMDKTSVADLATVRAYLRLLDEIQKEEAAFEKVLAANQDDLFADEFDRHNEAMVHYMSWKREMEKEMEARQIKGLYMEHLKRQLAPS